MKNGGEAAVVVQVAHVEHEDAPVEVSKKIERLDADVRLVQAALVQGPEASIQFV